MWGRKKDEKKAAEEFARVVSEAKSPDEILNIGVSMVTSALSARNTSNMDTRLKQYSDDLSMFLSEMNPVDTIVLNSFMADFAASLVIMVSESTGIPADECMKIIARIAQESSLVMDKKFPSE